MRSHDHDRLNAKTAVVFAILSTPYVALRERDYDEALAYGKYACTSILFDIKCPRQLTAPINDRPHIPVSNATDQTLQAGNVGDMKRSFSRA